MKKVISFSLYGTEPKYIFGAIKNAKLAREIFPHWVTVFYVSKEIPDHLLAELETNADEIILMPEPRNSTGMFWRFIEAGNLANSRVIFRDTDSRLSKRDARAVEEWEISGKSLHIIRDHPMHNAPLLGGLWGVIPASLKNFSASLQSYKPLGYYGEDQEFLWKNIYYPLRHSRFVHDEFFLREIRRNTIEIPRSENEYLGESFDEVDNYDVSKRVMIRNNQINHRGRNILKIKSVLMKFLRR